MPELSKLKISIIAPGGIRVVPERSSKSLIGISNVFAGNS